MPPASKEVLIHKGERTRKVKKEGAAKDAQVSATIAAQALRARALGETTTNYMEQLGTRTAVPGRA